MSQEVIMQFLKENWMLLAVAIVVLFVVVSFLKTVMKWVIVIGIVLGVALYSGYTIDDLNKVVTTVKDDALQTMKDQAMNAMIKEAKNAEFTQHKDGTYSIKTDNLEITGKKNADKVKVSFHGVSLGEMSMNDSTVKAFLDEAKK
ncbi:hypothetical protein BVG16_04430 [Paenibacillus selenitireducens]|jgi:hypothetical protein|uniref:Uncharacterized protein n=1 Tax=Paenibacillus selenitireducens TaxID=1324314 RepID=A0A1T2XJM3_9BACL|nr:hypothetical protein [Paenibacillus selenitireducens]OPA80005.1 hypothetical protein BVG16_04430 [Paenibacillus selenitireducens]